MGRGWSQDRLAEISGLGRTFISAVENARNEPCLTSIKTFAGAFGITMSQLLKGI